ncbi:zinc finger protein-like 1 isoform X1 [Mobula hypostoma]|uniref:zinc finger protein-like 1 isoform X1 n=1 Tax=Mobula hypostoma TaxID=723540 RepID=UPI002FC2C4A5
MGLCKCPKRRVTNLFCFEHRVNVCEHCLISKHSKCIVQSYLQWLQDSDYSPSCRLCSAPLAEADTVRLVCYDLFHWSCLNDLASRLPRNTAPAGYRCPSCSGPIFPPDNMVSPVASVLKERLATVNWARAGLGLPLVEEEETSAEQGSLDTTDWSSFSVPNVDEHSARTPAFPSDGGFSSLQEYADDPGGETKAARSQDVQPGSESFSVNVGTAQAASPRKVYDTIAQDAARSTATQLDFDDDKYRRRPALTWFARWVRNATGSGPKRRSLTRMQRLLLLLVLGVLAFLTLLVVMSRLGRASVENDPSWDLMQNPHIQVGAE